MAFATEWMVKGGEISGGPEMGLEISLQDFRARKHTVARCRGRTSDRQFLIRQEPKIRTYLRGKRRERVSRVDG